MPRESVWRILREPVLHETRKNLERSRARLLPVHRTPQQMLGRQGNGCGATIGAMPRCDFACRGCYLGDGANVVPPASLDEIKRQMRALRPLLGNAGNLQLTDGEVTLRPDDEVIALLRYANDLGLVPMLMTHGDSFRRRPGLLERYMVEGGLREVSIHVDTTQRGRQGARWRSARSEAELNPLREEFAQLLQRAVVTTGLPLRAATTMTVTRDNLAGVSDVIQWLAGHAEVFRMVSFQPIAQVGRTEDGLGGGVDVEELWGRIAEGLGDGAQGSLAHGYQWLGHPGCNRFVHGILAQRADAPARYLPIRRDDDLRGVAIIDEFLDRFGGVTFRRDQRREAVARTLALLARAPLFFARSVPAFAHMWMRRLGNGSAWAALRELTTGRMRLQTLVIVSHHFMSRSELTTPIGQERLSHCVFHVNVNGEMLSMCEVNALGHRDAYYDQLSGAQSVRAAATGRSGDTAWPGAGSPR